MGFWRGDVAVFGSLPVSLRTPGDLVIHTVSPISEDIGSSLGGMIIMGISNSMDGALGSLQSLLQGNVLIPGGLGRASDGTQGDAGAES